MDAAFRRILILIGVFFGGVVLVLVLARILFRRGGKSGPAASGLFHLNRRKQGPA